MGIMPAPGESYTIRQKVFKVFGNAFHVYGVDGSLVGYCRQKALRLREDLRFYTDTSQTTELFAIRARSVIDFGASYDVTLPSGERLGSLRQKGLRSMLRDQWVVFDAQGHEIATLTEDSAGSALARRFVPMYAMLRPQSLHLRTGDGRLIATLRAHMNIFVYRLGVAIHEQHPDLDDLMILAAGCLYAAVEGRQRDD